MEAHRVLPWQVIFPDGESGDRLYALTAWLIFRSGVQSSPMRNDAPCSEYLTRRRDLASPVAGGLANRRGAPSMGIRILEGQAIGLPLTRLFVHLPCSMK